VIPWRTKKHQSVAMLVLYAGVAAAAVERIMAVDG
jgi:hypothetical protein